MHGNNAIRDGLPKVLALVTGGKALLLSLLDVIIDAIITDMDKVGVLGILILADGLAADVRLELLDVVGQTLVGSLGPEFGGFVVAVVVGGDLEIALMLVVIARPKRTVSGDLFFGAGRRNCGQCRNQDDSNAAAKLHAVFFFPIASG